LGIGDWAQSPIPNPQSPIPNPQSPIPNEIRRITMIFIIFKIYLKYITVNKKLIVLIK
jgi:hypothetical protein